MASAYDEYERSLTGKWRRGLSPLAWAVVALLGLFVLGGVAVAAVVTFALKEAQEVVVDVVESQDAVVRLDNLGEAGRQLRELRHQLRHEARHELRSADVEAEVRRVLAASGSEVARSLSAERIAADVMQALENEFEGSFTLVIDGETLQFDMAGDEEQALFTLDAGGETYSLSIVEEGDGARLILSTPDGESVFQAGEAAQAAPSWVPRYPGSAHARSVFSGTISGSNGGAELAVTEDSPFDVVEHLTDALESEGFTVTVERLSVGHSDVQGSLVGTRESDGRAVAVVVVEDNGQTKVLTLWGDESMI